MYVRFLLDTKEKVELLTTMYEIPSFLPEKGDEIILNDIDNDYKHSTYKVIKRSIEYFFNEKETRKEPYEIKLYLKKIKK